jgi:hypothetical protein
MPIITWDTTFLFVVGCCSSVIGAYGSYLLLRQKVELHHKVLFDESGILRINTKQDCKERHAEDLTQLSLRLELVQQEMKNMDTTIKCLNNLMSTLLEKIQIEGGKRGYDPK